MLPEMSIKQISVFLENKPGRLAEVTRVLAAAGVNIHSLCIADTADFGILRMIVSDVELARGALKNVGLTAKTTDVVAMGLEHKPGSLAGVLAELEALGISIEYMYAFTSRSKEHDAIVAFRFADEDESLRKLMERRPVGVKLLGNDIIAGL